MSFWLVPFLKVQGNKNQFMFFLEGVSNYRVLRNDGMSKLVRRVFQIVCWKFTLLMSKLTKPFSGWRSILHTTGNSWKFRPSNVHSPPGSSSQQNAERHCKFPSDFVLLFSPKFGYLPVWSAVTTMDDLVKLLEQHETQILGGKTVGVDWCGGEGQDEWN